MDGLMDWASGLSVTGRVVVGVSVIVVCVALLVALTAFLIGLRRAVALWLVAAVGLLAALLLLPVDTAGLASAPDPATSFEDAKARFAAMRDDTPVPLNPLCEPELFDHGEKTETVVVLIHGVSSCPRAFVDFAPLLHERGHTVMTVRLPQNGYADRATNALKDMTAEELARFGDTSVDIAAGLGEEVIVLGISAGGTVAAWAGQNREDVDRAVMLAPFFGLAGFGPRINKVLMRAMLLLPSISIWKDPVLRERFEGMPHAYQRQETRGIGEIMRLGFATYRQATEDPPAADELVVVTNDADAAVSNDVTEAFVRVWTEDGKAPVTYVFPASDGLGHELIDPLEPGADPAITYPVIVRLLEGEDG